MNKNTVITIVIVTLLIIGALFVLGNKQTSQAPSTSDTAVDQDNSGNQIADPNVPVNEISMVAKQFSFEPETIKVKQGDRVRLKIKSIDVAHGFGLPDFNVSVDLVPEKEAVVEFVADKSGEFTFFCSVFCGAGHPEMKGTLIVE